MNVSELLDQIANLQPDNPDKVSSLLSIKYDSTSNFIGSVNPIFDNNIQLLCTKLFHTLFSSFSTSSNFTSYSSSYASSSSVNSLTRNLLNSQTNYIDSLTNNLYGEAGSISSYIASQNEIFKLYFNQGTINSLISCSVGINDTTSATTEELETLAKARLQFTKELVSWLNDKIKTNNLFYYYNTSNIKLNYSDDDGYDTTFAQLKSENQYNYYDSNYEIQSVLADEKLLPGIIHQIMLYVGTEPYSDTISGYFYSPENPKHFAAKQIYGNNLEFTTNNLQIPTISYNYNPNINGDAGNFISSSLYSNWNYNNYSLGEYTHPNNYTPVNEERTKLNNLNIHIDLSDRGTGQIYTDNVNNILKDQPPFYAKVSFGIPKQENNLLNHEGPFIDAINKEAALKTVFGSMINNLYVDGQIIDEAKIQIDSNYLTSSVNFNLLKFFKDNFNTSGEEIIDCNITTIGDKAKLPIGKDTGEIDEIYSSLGNKSNLTVAYRPLLPVNDGDDEVLLSLLLNLEETDGIRNFGKFLTLTDRASVNSFIDTIKANEYTKQKYYLFTKLAKYYVEDDGSDTLIQNFYFDLRQFVLNNPTDDINYTFYDNQIHSGKRYKYVASQFIIVPALAYGYTAADVVDDGGLLALHLGVSYAPIYKMIEVPITTESDIVVLEKPPVTPKVSFFPLLDKNNKVLIQISPSGFDKTEVPISIEDADISLFDKALESQNSTSELLFTKDFEESGIDTYEIFRTTSYPSSYSSFSNNKLDSIRANNITQLYTDTIETNVVYYYCIRSKNIRGLPSNPTKVYKITLVEDGQFFTLNQEIIENLNSEDIYSRSAVKDAKRFLYIAPSIVQVSTTSPVDGNAVDAVSDFPLGTASTEVWGKKFKIRIRSKSSGKTVDFNLTFNKNNRGEFIPE
jgi:hypothetical protein